MKSGHSSMLPKKPRHGRSVRPISTAKNAPSVCAISVVMEAKTKELNSTLRSCSLANRSL